MRTSKKKASIFIGCILVLAVLCSACTDRKKVEQINTEEFDLLHAELITVGNAAWPDNDGKEAKISVSIPSMYDAYLMACKDPDYNGENTIELMYFYLEETVRTIPISVPAELENDEWIYDAEALDRLIQEHVAIDVNAYLEAALADLEPIEINLEWEDIE